jgi:hypothetical protein
LLSGTESYLGQRNDIDVSAVLQDLFSFVILYNYIIPISLYVTIGECQLTLFELEVHKTYNYTRKAYFSIGILLLWEVCNTAMLVLSINRFI